MSPLGLRKNLKSNNDETSDNVEIEEKNQNVELENIIKHISFNGVDYPLAFTLNVIEKIQDKYGSYEKWGEMTDGKEQEVNIGALKYGIFEMINEGIDIENENKEIKRDFLTEKQVGRIITEIGLQEMVNKVQNTVIDSTKQDTEEKNV